MGENSSIEWTHHTFNPWWGCTKVGPPCDHCYAETLARRFGVRWGPGEPRRMASPAYWDQPLRWNRKAVKAGVRRRVFCASMADVFDNDHPWLDAARERLWRVIEETAKLDWLLLTKRIGNAAKMLPKRWLEKPLDNVWVGSTFGDQHEWERDRDKLLAIPAVIHFGSFEPLLGRITDIGYSRAWRRLDWVICGGESGHQARAMHPDWVREIRDGCVDHDIPFHFKQWGNFIPWDQPAASHFDADGEDCEHRWDPHGITYSLRVGKHLAGRVLDGRTWDELPIRCAP